MTDPATTPRPQIQHALRGLFRWADEQNFVGHDPHDLLNASLLRVVKIRTARLAAVQLGRRSILNLHTLLRVPQAENPKALALFMLGLLQAKDNATPNWESDAQKLAERLLASQHENGGWGYAFPWQSRTHFLPANTPNIVTTSFVGDALISLHKQFPSQQLLDAIHRAARYIVSLASPPNPLSLLGVGASFGYAEKDTQIVFNASLLGAEFLLKVGTLFPNSEYIALARDAAEFVAGHQRTDGGWNYGLEPSQQWEDSFHTGFVIVSMKYIGDAVGDSRLMESGQRGFEYYRKTFLEPDYAIRYFPGKRYPIDAHALGQAMVTCETFADHETALRIAEWSIENMRSSEGFFYYQKHRAFTNKIPYLRWSNAWMFLGLSSILSTEK